MKSNVTDIEDIDNSVVKLAKMNINHLYNQKCKISSGLVKVY